ncbi:hypothetical protein VTO42DRAFT_529 [Malbranchea cinnamomea]
MPASKNGAAVRPGHIIHASKPPSAHRFPRVVFLLSQESSWPMYGCVVSGLTRFPPRFIFLSVCASEIRRTPYQAQNKHTLIDDSSPEPKTWD